MENDRKAKIHLGAYCLVIKGHDILIIKKARGPYMGKYDLPGGKIEFGESIEECLRRELKEETGLDMADASFSSIEESVFDYVDEGGVDKKFHHVGMYYRVNVGEGDLKTDSDGHDSEGASFVDMDSIRPDEFSPIAYKAVKHGGF